MRLGIFGGSFDPVHLGHLAVAQACGQQASLDEVWFTPVAVQPLKHAGPLASDERRLEMLRLATKDEPRWRVCTLEIDRGGLSYSVDTLREIHQQLPEATLFFLVGADTLRDVARWKEPEELFRLATPLVVRRPGDDEPNLAALAPLCPAEHSPLFVNMPAIDASSSEIRRRIAAAKSIDDLVPPPVAEYIAAHGLYR
jgi:nicotinate-nucleotide adenylyltransferase